MPGVEHQERYRGEHLIITTERQADGRWMSKAELVQSGERAAVAIPAGGPYPSEEEARAGALSGAVSAIDRARVSAGKP